MNLQDALDPRGQLTVRKMDAHDALVDAMLDRHLVVGQQAHEVDKQTAGHDNRGKSRDQGAQARGGRAAAGE